MRNLHSYTPQRYSNGFSETKADVPTICPCKHCSDCVLEPEEDMSNQTFDIEDPNADCVDESVSANSQIGHSQPTFSSSIVNHNEMLQEPTCIASSDVVQSGLSSDDAETEALGPPSLVDSRLKLGLGSCTATGDTEEALYPGSGLKLQESQLLLEQYALTHHLSVSAHSDLSKVMATLLPSGNGFASRPYSSVVDDMVKRRVKVEHILYCEICYAKLPSEATGVGLCSSCGKTTTKPDVFSTLSLKDQIKLKFQGK